MELNPHHPVTELLHDSWHKIAFVLMKRLGQKEIVITARELAAAVSGPLKNIIAHDKHDGLHIILATEAEAQDALRRSRQ